MLFSVLEHNGHVFRFHSRSARVPWNGQMLLQLPAGGRRDDLDHMTKTSDGATPTSCTNITGFNQELPNVADTLPAVCQVQGHLIADSFKLGGSKRWQAVTMRGKQFDCVNRRGEVGVSAVCCHFSSVTDKTGHRES